MVGEPVEQRSGQSLRSQNLRPVLERVLAAMIKSLMVCAATSLLIALTLEKVTVSTRYGPLTDTRHAPSCSDNLALTARYVRELSRTVTYRLRYRGPAGPIASLSSTPSCDRSLPARRA